MAVTSMAGLSAAGCQRPPAPPTDVARQEVSDSVASFAEHLLAPARIPPPSVARAPASVSLLVTHRPSGRDQVAIRGGYTYARGAELRLSIGETTLPA